QEAGDRRDRRRVPHPVVELAYEAERRPEERERDQSDRSVRDGRAEPPNREERADPAEHRERTGERPEGARVARPGDEEIEAIRGRAGKVRRRERALVGEPKRVRQTRRVLQRERRPAAADEVVEGQRDREVLVRILVRQVERVAEEEHRARDDRCRDPARWPDRLCGRVRRFPRSPAIVLLRRCRRDAGGRALESRHRGRSSGRPPRNSTDCSGATDGVCRKAVRRTYKPARDRERPPPPPPNTVRVARNGHTGGRFAWKGPATGSLRRSRDGDP